MNEKHQIKTQRFVSAPLLEEYFAHPDFGATLAPLTQRCYRTDFCHLLSGLAEELPEPPHATGSESRKLSLDERRLVTCSHEVLMALFQKEIAGDCVEDKTLKRRAASASSLFNFLYKTGHRSDRIFVNLEKGLGLNAEEPIPTIRDDAAFSILAALKLKENFSDTRLRAFVEAAFYEGLKIETLLKLKIEALQISPDRESITLQLDSGKTRKLESAAVAALVSYCDARYYFLGGPQSTLSSDPSMPLMVNKAGQGINARSIRRDLKDFLDSENLPGSTTFNEIRMTGLLLQLRARGMDQTLLKAWEVPRSLWGALRQMIGSRK